MNTAIKQLEPSDLWSHFADINAIPRASKKEERIIDFMLAFGADLGLETIKDNIGNVIIKKPATKGFEHLETVVLQSHLDMVHQKNNDTQFNFDEQGIDMYIDGDWVRANGTTLGADNGIGVAAIMALLSSKAIQHPTIEALFTIDEETGMTGAKALQNDVLKGNILLNLDTENDEEITIGCAGGLDITAQKKYSSDLISTQAYTLLKITVNGLQGGHSGMEIHKGLGNANKIMNRVLYACLQQCELRIHEINGGGLRNAIPRESVAVIAIPTHHVGLLTQIVAEQNNIIKQELYRIDPSVNISLSAFEYDDLQIDVLPEVDAQLLIKTIYAAANGVYRMSNEMQDLVETSNNIARVTVKGGNISIQCLTRSSVDTSKQDLANALKSTFELMGADVQFSGDYPGWTPNIDSPILQLMKDTYRDKFGSDAHVSACHAGLECGIISGHYPSLDMISFGPTIEGAHSPDERVSISSVQKFWSFLLEVLQKIPKKN